VEVLPDDTLDTLEERIHAVEHKLLPATLQLIAQGKVRVEGNKTVIG